MYSHGQPSIRAVDVEGHDGEAVHRLAALSGRKAPTGAVLLAELAGDPVAAIGIFDGNIITDRVRSDQQSLPAHGFIVVKCWDLSRLWSTETICGPVARLVDGGALVTVRRVRRG